MDTTKIKAFLLAEKHKSFSKVAEELAYTPSALSHMADSLEAELGVVLFKRTSRGVELTEAGAMLRDKFVAVAEAEEALFRAADELSRRQRSVLRIGTYSSIARHILPEILHAFKQAYPSVETTITVEDNVMESLHAGQLDIVFTDEYHRANGTKWHPIMEDHYVVAAPRGVFADRSAVDREELYAYSFIRVDEKLLDDYFDYSRFLDVIRIRSIEYETAVSMVKENVALTVLPELTMRHCPDGVEVFRLMPKVSRMIGVQYNRSQMSVPTERFVRFIKRSYQPE